MRIKNKKTISIILGLAVVLITVGTVGALNGWFAGSAKIPEDTFTQGLVGYWSMDEGNGTTAYDSSGNNNNGGLNGPQWTQGKVGGALSFDGVNDYVNAGNAASLDITQEITVEAWAKYIGNHAKSGDWDQFFVVKSGNYKEPFIFGFYANQATLYASHDGSAWDWEIHSGTYGSTGDSGWHHFAFSIHKDFGAKLYIDGVLKGSDTSTGTLKSEPSFNLEIGRRAYGYRYFEGFIDEVRIYNRALSAEEIRFHYNRSGPIGYWKLDEGSGSTAYDSSGNSNTGTLYGGMATSTVDDSGWKSGKYGSALSFDGTDDRIIVPNTTSLQQPTTAITLEAWIKADTFTAVEEEIISKSIGSYYYKIYLATNGKFVLDLNIVGTRRLLVSTLTLSAATWYHVVGTYDGTTRAIYINGVLDTSNALYTGALTSNTDDLSIGGRLPWTDYGFDGLIDEVRIYNYARSADEIALDYNAGFAARFGPQSSCEKDPGSCMTKGLVGYWNMDEGSGQTLYDGSGNANNGTVGQTGSTESIDPKWTSGVSVPYRSGASGSGLSFDGVDDYVKLPAQTSVKNQSVRTLEVWIYSNTLGKPVIFEGTPEGNSRLRIDVTTNGSITLAGRRLDADSYTIFATSSTGAITTGVWYNITGIYDGNTGNHKIYKNGLDITVSSSGTTGAFSNTNPLNTFIGFSGASFSGTIDEVRIYNRVLSAEEIRYLYNRGGPVGYWKFDEGGGQTAFDSTENNNDGCLGLTTAADAADPIWISGKYGTALSFDGTDDYVDCGTTIGNPVDNKISVGLWFRVLGGSGNRRFPISKYSAPGWYFEVTNTNYIRVVTYGLIGGAWTTITIDGTDVSDESWNHVVMVWNKPNLYFYQNGQLKGVKIANFDTLSNNNPLSIGEDSSYNRFYFNGLIDDVRIYNYARAADEIKLDYNAGFAARIGPTSDCSEDPGSCITKGLVGYWGMDEGGGQYAYDGSGNNNTGTLTSSPTWTTGKVGQALSFDGVNDYVNVADASNLNFGVSESFTVEAWIKTSDTIHWMSVVLKGSSPPLDYYILSVRQDCGQAGFNIRDSAGHEVYTNGGSDIRDGNWHHIVGVRDVAAVLTRVYVDGVEKDTSPDTTTDNISSTRALIIGGTDLFKGTIDEVRIYNRALSAEEIRYHYNRGGPVAQWKFDEGNGQTAFDSTNNNNDGQLGSTPAADANDPTWTSGKYGSALSFDGGDDYVNVSSANLGLTNKFTFSVWTKIPSSETDGHIIVIDSAGLIRVRLLAQQTIIWQIVANSNVISIGSEINNNSWHYIAGTYDGSVQKIYVDGIEKDSDTNSGNIGSGGTNIGAASNGGYLNGLIDEVRIYNYARSQSQIQQDYNEGTAVHF